MRKALYILSILDDGDIDWLVNSGVRKDLADGEMLIQAGEQVTALYFVVDGEFSVLLGDSKVVSNCGVGEVLGEISFLDSRPPITSVRASGQASVFGIPREKLTAKLRSDKGLASRFYCAVGQFLAHRLRETTLSMGYGENIFNEDDMDSGDELPEELMESVSLGGARFNWILEQFRKSST